MSHRKARINEIVSMVEEEKEKGAKEVHIVARAVFIPERKKRMGVSLDRQKARIKQKKHHLRSNSPFQWFD